MSAIIMDGAGLAAKIREELAAKVARLGGSSSNKPGIAVILAGDDPASEVYVGNKETAALKAGFYSELRHLPAGTSEEELLRHIDQLNSDIQIHGILVQLPLPEHINPFNVLLAIDPRKDVDGFHPLNVGMLNIGRKAYTPCTPLGVMRLLEEYNINIEGKRAVIVGRSNIVGKPMATLLTGANATVTVCHSRTKDLSAVCREADILVAATGKPCMITADHVKPGAVIIDVGINRVDGKLCGDVDFDAVKEIVSYITPVPKGVGPMTIAMLLQNTFTACYEPLY